MYLERSKSSLPSPPCAPVITWFVRHLSVSSSPGKRTRKERPHWCANARVDRGRRFVVDDSSLASQPASDEWIRGPAREAVTRVEPETFRVTAGSQKILWLEVEPVGLIRIVPTEHGCDQILEGAVMNDVKASRTGKADNALIAAMNSSLRDLRMRNRISALRDAASGDEKIKCQIDISGTFTEGPFAAAGSARLNSLLAWCLGTVMPWFLDQLTKDYGDWAAGKPRGREKVNVAAVAGEILGGSRGKLPPGITEVECEPPL